MALNQWLRDLVVEFGLGEPDYGLMIGSGRLALLAYPDNRIAVVAAPAPADEMGWTLFACDPGSEVSLRQAVAAVAALIGPSARVAEEAGSEAVAAEVAVAALGGDPAAAVAADELTAEQEAAVTHPPGRPARVLAGAGTGKTRVIVARFGHLVASGVSPARILALTFSRPAAAQMRTEVMRHLTASAALSISTFHSFCLRVLETELAQPVQLLHEAEARAVLAGLAGDVSARRVEEAHAFIGQAKDQLLTPDEVAAYAAAQQDDRLIWLADLYRRFQEELARQGAAEFGDFISKVAELFAGDPAAAARWQGRFDHILVDEFQDTNLAQFRVLEVLAAPHRNLMVVGDDDQAIYRFRGAADRFMRQFQDYFQDSVDHPVMENFRCPAPVLAVANRLIERNAPERVAKRLFTRTKAEGYPDVACFEARTDREEADAVAGDIERRIKQGRRASDIAILLRSVRRSGGEFARALRERGIPFRLSGEAYPHPVTAQTLALLRLTRGVTPQDLLTVLAGRVAPAELFAALRKAQVEGDLVAQLAAGHGPAVVVAAYQQVVAWIASTKELPVPELIYEALRFLGHLRLSLTPSAVEMERLAAVRLLQDAAAGAASVAALLAVEGMLSAPTLVAGGADAVTIMTIHAAKGLEYRVVFVPALVEGRFPVDVDADPVFYLAEAIRDWADAGLANQRTGTEDRLAHQRTGTDRPAQQRTGADRLAQHIREERRLAYVALTRAQEELVVSWALRYGGEPAQPSRFLAEMGAPEPVAVSGRGGDLVGQARSYLLEAAAGIRRVDEGGVAGAAAVLRTADSGAVPLRRQVDPAPFGGSDSLTLSASASEIYRDCPRKYYYAYVLRLPDEDNVYTAFGSALHDALERFNLARMCGAFPSCSALAAMWDEAMKPAAFVSEGQFGQLKARGRLFLERFYNWAAVAPRQVVETEGKFAFDYIDGKGRTHRIRGRYDLVERDRDGNEEIIDYKSGTRESTGVTKGLRGMSDKHPQRKLQLGLYYLARHGGKVVPGARVSYIFLKHAEDKPPLTWAPAFDPGEQAVACEHTAETLQGIRGIIDGVIDGILANEFPRDIEERKCGMCAFRDACEVGRRAFF